MTDIGILLRGKSLEVLDKYADKFQECYIVNDWKREIARFGNTIKGKKIKHFVNAMYDAALPSPIYKTYNIKEIVFAFTKGMIKKGRRPFIPYKNLNIPLTLLPDQYEKKALSFHNTGICCIFYVSTIIQPESIWVIGLDFYQQDYMVKKNAPHHKKKSKDIDMVGTFLGIVNENPMIQYNVVTYYKDLPSLPNLNVEVLK